jgi:uncharacterized protein YjbI with pentapeptide repeats
VNKKKKKKKKKKKSCETMSSDVGFESAGDSDSLSHSHHNRVRRRSRAVSLGNSDPTSRFVPLVPLPLPPPTPPPTTQPQQPVQSQISQPATQPLSASPPPLTATSVRKSPRRSSPRSLRFSTLAGTPLELPHDAAVSLAQAVVVGDTTTNNGSNGSNTNTGGTPTIDAVSGVAITSGSPRTNASNVAGSSGATNSFAVEGQSSSFRRAKPHTGGSGKNDAVWPTKTASGSLGDAGIGDSSDDEDTLLRDLDDELHIRPDASNDADVSAAISDTERLRSNDADSSILPSSGRRSSGARAARPWPQSPGKSRHWRATRRAISQQQQQHQQHQQQQYQQQPQQQQQQQQSTQTAAPPMSASPQPGLASSPARPPLAVDINSLGGARNIEAPRDAADTSSEIWGAGNARIIELNVGGTYFATSSTTIAMYRDSLLYKLAFGRIGSARDAQGRIFIDRDGAVFRYVLNFMREGRLSLPMNFDEYEALLWASEFYHLRALRHEVLAQLAQVRRERLVRFLSLTGLDLSAAPLSGVDFEGMSLAGMNLRGAFLEGACLRDADLRGADLRDCSLQHATLDGALLDEAQLQKADMRHVSLIGASLADARLTSANLSDARFTDAFMAGASLSDSNVTRALFDNVNLQGVDFRGANLSEASLESANLSECSFCDATLIGTRLRSANLRLVDFRGAMLRDCSFESAVLVGANFEQARIERLNLTMANLATATLRYADLRGSLFGGGKSDIGPANLANADLTSCQMQNLNLRGVSFEGANLTEANFTGADTAGCKMQGAHRINTIGLRSK